MGTAQRGSRENNNVVSSSHTTKFVTIESLEGFVQIIRNKFHRRRRREVFLIQNVGNNAIVEISFSWPIKLRVDNLYRSKI